MKGCSGPGTYEFHGSQSARAAVPDLIKVSEDEKNFYRLTLFCN